MPHMWHNPFMPRSLPEKSSRKMILIKDNNNIILKFTKHLKESSCFGSILNISTTSYFQVIYVLTWVDLYTALPSEFNCFSE